MINWSFKINLTWSTGPLLTLLLILFSCSTPPKSESGAQKTDIDKVIKILGDSIIYDGADRSFSPLYSDIGLVFNDYAGLTGVYYHFNRRNTAINKVLEIDAKVENTVSDLLGVTQFFDEGNANFTFYDHNSFIVVIEGQDTVKFNFNPKTEISIKGLGEYKYTYTPWVEKKDDVYIFKGYMPHRDNRDPDPMFPIAIGIKVLQGDLFERGHEGLKITEREGVIKLALHFQILELNNEEIISKLDKAPATNPEARELTRQWFTKAIGDLSLNTGTEQEQRIAAKAAMALTFNACAPTGMMKGRIATFPGRGTYATLFEWDAAFQNLAYELMDPKLAEDAILIQTETMRPDGKIGQFITSTYLRPIEIQVPLTGWASKRLYEKRKDKDFIRKVLPALVKNNEWIINNRMTHYGLTSTLTPWELWDDTPRLDRGAIIACDFNADLLMQIQACEFFARELGDTETELKCNKLANKIAGKMVEVLYDEEANIFRDVLVETGEKLPIITPANFVPLLADVPISDEKARAMIQTYLLDTTKMFGYVPFPSVAYDEPSYVAVRPNEPNWLTWRGPTWMPMAWMMLDVLKKYGFEEEYKHAANRIYELLISDGELRELFNSQTGEGVGVPQCGWTAAIFLKLKSDLNK